MLGLFHPTPPCRRRIPQYVCAAGVFMRPVPAFSHQAPLIDAPQQWLRGLILLLVGSLCI